MFTYVCQSTVTINYIPYYQPASGKPNNKPTITVNEQRLQVSYWYIYIIEPRHDKTNKVTVRPAKTQIRPVWSEPSLCAQWVPKDPSFLHADSEDSDQTGWMPRLIWVFAGRTVILLVLSWGGSYLGSTFSRAVHTDDEVNATIAIASVAFDRLRGNVWRSKWDRAKL